ncbi:hypothetical protein HPB47_002893, partial [Ixodes persulcatus]
MENVKITPPERRHLLQSRHGARALHIAESDTARKDSCRTESGQRGTCMPLFDCQRLEKQIDQRRYHPPCGVKRRVPYVCCPRNETLPLGPIQHDAHSRDFKVAQLAYQNGVC